MALTLEDVQRRRVTPDAALSLVQSALAEKRPFSMVRQNDGEAVMLGAFRDVGDEEVAHFLNHWWKRQEIDRELVEDVRNGLLEAAASADILGFFDQSDGVRGKYARAGRLLRQYADIAPTCAFTDPEIHYHWQRDDRFRALLDGRDHVLVVSNYDLVTEVSRHFKIANLSWIPVPGHARYTDPRRQAYRHYPERYRELRRILPKAEAGTLALVGAGVLGKMYCHWLKQAGCVALDIGSVFDFWAQNRGRRSVNKGATRRGL